MAHPKYRWHRQTMRETFERIQQMPSQPWVALGDFLDDWRRSDWEDRSELVQEPIGSLENDRDIQQWAAFCAATVEWLCWQNGLPLPGWTADPMYHLDVPWFLYPGDLLKPWQLATTPTPFRMRNIFGGDHMLDRV